MLIAFLPVGVLCPSPGGSFTPGGWFTPRGGCLPRGGLWDHPTPSLAYPPPSERVPRPRAVRARPWGRGCPVPAHRALLPACWAAPVTFARGHRLPCGASCPALLGARARQPARRELIYLDGCWFEPGRGKAVRSWRGRVIVLGVFRVTGVGVVSSSALVLVAGARPCCATAVGARLLALSATTSSTVTTMRAPTFSGCARGTTGVRRRPRRRPTWPRCAPVWHRRRARTRA